MKKRLALLSLSLCTALSSMPFVNVYAAIEKIASVDGVEYSTIQEAIDSIESYGVIELLKNVEDGDGFVVKGNKELTIDFGDYTYELNGALVGSPGTETLGIQIFEGNSLSLVNGELSSDKAKILVQNYGTFSTGDMVLDYTKPTEEGKTYYAVSINNGTYSSFETLINANGNVAIDGYLWPTAGYGSVNIMLDASTINGDITLGGDGTTTDLNVAAVVFSSIVNGDLIVDDYIKDNNVQCDVMSSKVNDTFKDYIMPGTEKNEDGFYVPVAANFKVDTQYGQAFYPTLEAAMEAASQGATIELLKDTTGSGIVFPEGRDIAIDFNGHKYTINEETVGSTGTQTLGFQILKDSNVVLKNGTLESKYTKVLIQNYADLEIENMVIDNQRADTEKTYYTIGNNNGSLVLKNSTVKATEGHVAFDVYYWSKYYPDGVSVEVHNSKVIGDIEYGGDGVQTDYADKAQLNIHSIDLDGSIKETATLPEHGIEIWNGTFTELPKTDYLVDPSTAKFELNADGKYEVVAKNPYLDGGILVDNTTTNGEAAIYFELHDITKGSEVLVKLYSEDDEYLTYKKITAPVNGDLGCSFYTVGTSSSWEQDSWTAHDLVIPAYAELYIDGVKVAIDNVDFKTENWADFPGTIAPTIDGGILVDRIETDNEAGLYFELENLPTNKAHTYRVELYSGETYLTYKEITLKSEGVLGCTFYTVGTSSSWKQDEWTAKEELVPTHAVFYIDGVKVGTDEVEFEKEDWYKFPGTEHAHGVLENVKEATCTEEGYTGDLVCPICGEVLEEGTVIEKETHDYKLDETTVKEATCTEDGYTGDMVCKCGDIIKGEVIEALGHEDADRDGKCDECDADVEVIPTRVEEIAEVLKELHEAVENGDLEALKEAVAKMEEVDAKYEDAEEATEEEIAELIELMGCETEDELFEMILTDTLVASFVLELEEPYNAFKEERTLENAEALIEAVYDPENLEYFAMFYDDIEDLYAEAEELVAEAKEDEKPSDDKEEPKPSDKEENKPSDDKDDNKDDNTNKGDSPVTGDSANIAGLSFAFLASLVGILYALINKKRVD